MQSDMDGDDRTSPEELTFRMPDDNRIAAVSYGLDDAEHNVLFLHGFLDCAATFQRLCPLILKLSDNNVRMVCMDFSGHGKSSHRIDHTIYRNTWIEEAITVADALGWDRFHLVAHSFGAGVAVILAGTVPHRIQTLTLLDSSGPGSVPAEKIPILSERNLANRHRLLKREARVYTTFDQTVERMTNTPAQLSQTAAKILCQRQVERVEGGWRFSHDPRLAGTSNSYLTEDIIRAFISRIPCPVQIVWASHRWYYLNMEQIEERYKVFKRLSLVKVPGGHHVHLENPELVAPHILKHIVSSGDPPNHTSKL